MTQVKPQKLKPPRFETAASVPPLREAKTQTASSETAKVETAASMPSLREARTQKGEQPSETAEVETAIFLKRQRPCLP